MIDNENDPDFSGWIDDPIARAIARQNAKERIKKQHTIWFRIKRYFRGLISKYER